MPVDVQEEPEEEGEERESTSDELPDVLQL